MEKLYSPWRLRYVASGRRKARGCVFCLAIQGRPSRRNLVLFRGRENFIILNKYPYNNGHLMIVPTAHIGVLEEARGSALDEMMSLTVRCEAALRRAYRPSGINLGMNLGRSAGAGSEGHYHMHVVPRWDGDTNFMSVVHGTRVIPEDLEVTYRRLRPLLQDPPDAGSVRRRRASVP